MLVHFFWAQQVLGGGALNPKPFGGGGGVSRSLRVGGVALQL